jgi:GT2 family glycosyltransferase
MNDAIRALPVSIVIPTYRRGQVLVDTVGYLRALEPPAAEILLVDQTERHDPAIAAHLLALDASGAVRWMRLPAPSITRAMNEGLRRASQPVVLYLDDDIVPGDALIAAHHAAQASGEAGIVAGQVLQPGEQPTQPAGEFRFTSSARAWIDELMGGNFSVKRALALELGGFDENFVHVAYRFEAEFCSRARSAGERILYEPAASIRHLRAGQGGTRAFGQHLTTARPSHSVGAYYYLLAARGIEGRVGKMAWRFARSVRTRHHLRRPWWIPATLAAEAMGLLWALRLRLAGPRLLAREGSDKA